MSFAGLARGLSGGARHITDQLGFTTPQTQTAHLKQMEDSAQAFADYRPETMQARMNVMQNTAQMYQPYLDALQSVYGGSAPQFDLSKIGVDPFQNPNAPAGMVAPPPPVEPPPSPFVSEQTWRSRRPR